MRAWVLEDFGRLEPHCLEAPQGEGVLLRVAACGVCGSDLSVYKGSPAMRARWQPPLVLGHEVVGVVAEGPPDWLGRAVAVNPLVACGRCAYCRAGRENLCPQRTNLGFHYPGGFAQQIRVPLGQLYPLPPGLPLWKGALAEPLAVALRAVELAGPLLGRRAWVVGGGAIGSLVAWALRQGGAGVWVSETNPLRQAWLAEQGFALGPAEGGFDLVFETVGSAASLEAAVQGVAPGGRVVLVGLAESMPPLPLQRVVLQEVEIKGSYVFTHADFQRAVALLPKLPEGLAQVRPFEEVREVFAALLQGWLGVPKVVLRHPEEK